MRISVGNSYFDSPSSTYSMALFGVGDTPIPITTLHGSFRFCDYIPYCAHDLFIFSISLF